MRGKRAKKKRKVFNGYNLLLIISIVIILVAGYIILERMGKVPPFQQLVDQVVEWWNGLELGKNKETEQNQNNNQTTNTNTNVNANTNTNKTTNQTTNEANKPYVIDPGVSVLEDITEEKAKEIAIEQFRVLGETSLTPESLECIKIKRDDTLYYYISSANNTIEIKIEGGVITRINSELVSK